ncbi:S9 family peptidase [Halococcus thailandensis]|uniref:Prolyl oligopeptidase family protein n=1 Tax=Halococcus thailandensis JCM 13552 TaxID=1227457 RepID=M0MXX4_9EURY|nr:S9 family peptidase [Halococcus thailandensis]EMA49699.1 prolyl oligopeptidase family protein [Halococcus thailandensis JCM 13552]
MRSIERYLNVRSAYGASFSPAGDLAFLFDATGTPQVWSLSEPGRWPDQRTFSDERVTTASFSPEREELIFGMDEGGNERAQLFRLAPDGEIQPLTDDPDTKHRWGGWSHDGERFAFAANRRDTSVFDVYTQGRTETGDDATRVHEGDGWLTVAGFSPSDDRLLVTESHSSFDQDLYVLDLDTQEIEHVTPHDGDVRFLDPSWSPDGDALYLVTDRESDTLSLARLDLATGDLEIVADGDDWNVEGITLDEDTGRLVYARNVDGYTDLTVGRLAGDGIEEFPAPDLPEGVAGGVAFDANAERFAVTVTGRRENTNVHVVDVETGESERWTNASTAGLDRESFRTPELVRYESFDDREIPAFFSLPVDAEEDATPVVVDIHGGPESQRRPSFSPVTQYLLSVGYAVFEPNVRGSTGYGKAYTHLDDRDKRMDSVADIERGVAWLHEQPAVDPERIAVMGGSYGGFMTLASLTEYPDLWAAGVDIVGIADFTTFLENTGSWRRALREAEYGSLEDDRELLESISPLNSIERIDAPLFVLHGENDPRVPVGEAEQVAARVGERVPVETLIFDDEGHGIVKRDNRIEAYTAIADFLAEHV